MTIGCSELAQCLHPVCTEDVPPGARQMCPAITRAWDFWPRGSPGMSGRGSSIPAGKLRMCALSCALCFVWPPPPPHAPARDRAGRIRRGSPHGQTGTGRIGRTSAAGPTTTSRRRQQQQRQQVPQRPPQPHPRPGGGGRASPGRRSRTPGPRARPEGGGRGGGSFPGPCPCLPELPLPLHLPS